MRKAILLRTVFAVILVIIISFFSFILTSDFSEVLSGRVVTQVYVTGFPPANCSINLKEGINMVSFFCADESLDVNRSLVDVNNQSLDYVAVFYYKANNINDSWASYNPNLPSWTTQSINNLERRKGYVIIMNSTGEFFSDGLNFQNTVIGLQEGWNFIGYPSDHVENISQVLFQINGKYVRVEAYQVVNESNYWRSYYPAYGGTLTVMEPMIGYWILMNESASIII